MSWYTRWGRVLLKLGLTSWKNLRITQSWVYIPIFSFDPYDDESPQDKATREEEEKEEAELEEAEEAM